MFRLLLANCFVLLFQKKPDKEDDSEETPNYSIRSLFSDDEFMQEKSQNNLVSSLAEKAMSVAAPVMPTKSDGELDHERLILNLCLIKFNVLGYHFYDCCVDFVEHIKQTGCSLGRTGTKGWNTQVSWESCFALGWHTWGYELDG